MKKVIAQTWYFDGGYYVNEATGGKLRPTNFYRYKKLAERAPGVSIKIKYIVVKWSTTLSTRRGRFSRNFAM